MFMTNKYTCVRITRLEFKFINEWCKLLVPASRLLLSSQPTGCFIKISSFKSPYKTAVLMSNCFNCNLFMAAKESFLVVHPKLLSKVTNYQSCLISFNDTMFCFSLKTQRLSITFYLLRLSMIFEQELYSSSIACFHCLDSSDLTACS